MAKATPAARGHRAQTEVQESTDDYVAGRPFSLRDPKIASGQASHEKDIGLEA